MDLKTIHNNLYTGLDITYKPTNYLVFTVSPGYQQIIFRNFSMLPNQILMDNDKYIFASIDRKTISTSFRVNLNLSPDLTFQYWGQPFVATGKYYDHKYITDPMADNYSDRFLDIL